MKKYFYAVLFLSFSTGLCAQPLCSGEPNPGSVEAQDTLLCTGDSVFLSLTGITESGLMFQWESSPDGVTYTGIGGAIDSVYSGPVTEDTWFHCVVTCVSSGETSTTQGKRIYVSTAPPSGGTITETHTGSTYFFEVDGLTGTYTYNWNFGDDDSSFQSNPTHTYATGGVYTIIVIVTNGCGADTLQHTTTVVASVEERGGKDGIVIYPNPATNGFFLTSENTHKIDRLKMVDVYGRACWIQESPLSLPAYISMANLRPGPGIYILELEAGKQHLFVRLVLE